MDSGAGIKSMFDGTPVLRLRLNSASRKDCVARKSAREYVVKAVGTEIIWLLPFPSDARYHAVRVHIRRPHILADLNV